MSCQANNIYRKFIALHLQKHSAAEAHRILIDTCGDYAVPETMWTNWFRRFKNNDFNVEYREISSAVETG